MKLPYLTLTVLLPLLCSQLALADVPPATKMAKEEQVYRRVPEPDDDRNGITVHKGYGYPHPSFFADHKDYEWMFRRSEWIGLCSYTGYVKRGEVDFFNPPIAQFHTIKRLKGPALQQDIPINYKFYDQQDAKIPEGWHFTEDRMPPLNSKWIIFIPISEESADHGFYTYDGCYGRQPATEENLAELYAIIDKHDVTGQQGPP